MDVAPQTRLVIQGENMDCLDIASAEFIQTMRANGKCSDEPLNPCKIWMKSEISLEHRAIVFMFICCRGDPSLAFKFREAPLISLKPEHTESSGVCLKWGYHMVPPVLIHFRSGFSMIFHGL